MTEPENDLWVLTFVVDDSDPSWQTRNSVIGTAESLSNLFDLTRLPFGARLLKGKQAARYIKQSIKEEQRYNQEQRTKREAGGVN
jgi:hypothetical protein